MSRSWVWSVLVGSGFVGTAQAQVTIVDSATIAFEDLTTSSDEDYNDVVFRYRHECTMSGTTLLPERYSVTPLAMGAGLTNELWLKFPAAPDKVSAREGGASPRAAVLCGAGSEWDPTCSVEIDLYNDFAAGFETEEPGFINTDPLKPVVAGKPIVLEVDYGTGFTTTGTGCPDATFELRRSDGTTIGKDTKLQGTNQPLMARFSGSFMVPTEHTKIFEAYSGFSAWLTSVAGGCTGTACDGSDWMTSGVSGKYVARPDLDSTAPFGVVPGANGSWSATLIPAGTFTMGCVDGRDQAFDDTTTTEDSWCFSWESPSHPVTLTKSFYMMESELTQDQWAGLEFSHSGFGYSGSTKPAETVNWWEALEAANAASVKDGLDECYTLTGCSNAIGSDRECTGVTVTSSTGHPKDCTGWRLPTEAEWEYAARAGKDFPYSGGSDVDEVAWYSGNDSPFGTKPVCTTPTPRNAWGLCDMSGNVYEWVWDRYVAYSSEPATDPTGPASGSRRVVRGGYWGNSAQGARVAVRSSGNPGDRSNSLGFRLVRSVP